MSVEKWLGSLRSKSTKKVYLAGLKDFSRAIGVDIEEYISKLRAGYNPYEDLLKHADSFVERKTPPKTVNNYMLGVRSFLESEFDYELTKKQRRQLRNRLPRGKRARTVEDEITREKIQRILNQCPLKGRALFLFLVSSGIRVGEALQLTLDDVGLESVPIKVNVRGEYTKTGDKYFSFISKEAQNVLEEWLKTREQYLRSSAKRGIGLPRRRGVKSAEDNRIFPFSFQVASMMWNSALEKAGLHKRDNGTNRRTLHIHMLRKFFNSQLKGEAGVPRAIVECLVGHEEGLAGAYDRFTEKQIREWYLKGEPYLTISMPQEIREMREQYDKRLEDMQTIANGLTAKNLKLEQRMEDLESLIEENKKLLQILWKVQGDEKMRQGLEEIRQSDLNEHKWRDEMMKKETFTEDDRKQIKRARKRLKKIKQKKGENP